MYNKINPVTLQYVPKTILIKDCLPSMSLPAASARAREQPSLNVDTDQRHTTANQLRSYNRF